MLRKRLKGTRLGTLYEDTRWRMHAGSTFLRAWAYRKTLSGTSFIGITGSAGKTTTKDLTRAILATHSPVQSTDRSSNIPIRVAEKILETRREHKFCVLELGADKPGGFNLPLRLVRPRIGALTVIRREHHSAFRTIDAIAAEKGKLIAALPPGGTAVLNIDDPWVRSIGKACASRIVWVGEAEGATIRLRDATSTWPDSLRLEIEHEGHTYEVATQLHGTQLSQPVLTSLGIALAAGLSIDQAIEGIAGVAPAEGRMQIVHGEDGILYIRDDWKAPQWSLAPPLEFLGKVPGKRKVAILGTISDYTGDSRVRYKEFARQAREHAHLVIFVGPQAHRALGARIGSEDQSIQGFFSIRDAAAYLDRELKEGDTVLIKGSHKADHLVRLLLNRSRPIECWTDDCEAVKFCGSCARLHRPAPGWAASQAMVAHWESGDPIPRQEEKSTDEAWTVLGLGNPAAPQDFGYKVLDALLDDLGGAWEKGDEGFSAMITVDGISVRLFKPSVNMVNTGRAVRRFLEQHEIRLENCVFVHEDRNLEAGLVESRWKPGNPGHKGLTSVITTLGTASIRRVRIGTGARLGGQGDNQGLSRLPEGADALAQGMAQAIAAIRRSISDAPGSAQQPGVVSS